MASLAWWVNRAVGGPKLDPLDVIPEAFRPPPVPTPPKPPEVVEADNRLGWAMIRGYCGLPQRQPGAGQGEG